MTMPDQAPQTLDEVIEKNIAVDLRGYTDNEEATMWLKSLKTDLTALIERVIGEDEAENYIKTVFNVNGMRNVKPDIRNQLRAEQRKRLGELL